MHFANRAAHTALFLKAMANIPFSITAHGQDFMADLGNDDLLREICDEAEFVAVETEYSRGLMAARCPNAANKIHRVYNGMDLTNFLDPSPSRFRAGPVQILSVGRLVAFKGFEYLIEACEQMRQRSIPFRCEIIGDGPLRESLQHQIDELRLGSLVTLAGALPQDCVLEKLQSCDIFALASTVDDSGASDIFPDCDPGGDGFGASRGFNHGRRAFRKRSWIRKRDCSSRQGRADFSPTRWKRSAGIRELRARYGSAGRARMEKHFQVETTVRPLVDLLEKTRPRPGADRDSPASVSASHGSLT